ncbi:hypothetical protein [Bacillus sp. NPDC077027]|uniref:hypothetical protein n=1 Tax=Bacillus sp. NPDC077027 TaxID=3390548 RepID=UPI003D0565A9
MDINSKICNPMIGDNEHPIDWMLTVAKGTNIYLKFWIEDKKKDYLTFIGKNIIENPNVLNGNIQVDTVLLGNATEFMLDADRLAKETIPFLKNDGILLFWIDHEQTYLQLKSITTLLLFLYKKGFTVDITESSLWTGFKAKLAKVDDNDFIDVLLNVWDKTRVRNKEQDQYQTMTSHLLKELVAAKKEKLLWISSEGKLLEQAKKTEQELNLMKRRYQALSSSKLGRLTLAYWRFRSQRRKGR